MKRVKWFVKCFQHCWLVDRHDFADGDSNIVWGYLYIELQWPLRVKYQSFFQDGLPIRRVDCGPIAVGYSKTHEWFSCT